MDKTSEKDRVNEMIDAVVRVARGDYSVQIECSGRNDDLDSLAIGINMMTNDIERDVIELKQAEKKLEGKMESLEKFANVTVDRELRMVEMKKEVDELLKKVGEKPRYYKV